MQRLILPIDPREVEGNIERVNVRDNQIEIEISVHDRKSYGRIKSSLYYSFEYQDLRLKHDQAQLEQGRRSETRHTYLRGKTSLFLVFDDSKDDVSSRFSVDERSQLVLRSGM